MTTEIGIPYRPSAEQARLHLRNAVLYVLAQPPVQGRSALTQLGSLVASTYFPTETQRAIVQLKNSALQKPSDALVRGFVDKLLFGFFEPNSPLRAQEKTVAAINACIEMHRPIADQRVAVDLPKIAHNVPDADFSGVIVLVARVDPVWSLMDATTKDKVVQFIRLGTGAVFSRSLVLLHKIDVLKAEVDARIKKLTVDELATATENGLGTLGKSRAIELLSGSKSWIQTNSIIDKALTPILSILTDSDVESIIKLQTI
jgi:hypothetical protein